jgi:hypothetical protein
MDFGLKKARSTTGASKNISVTSGILIGATLLFAGVAVAQTAADKQVESIRPDRLPPEQIVLPQEEPVVQIQEVSEPEPSLDTMTPYQWGSLSVQVMNESPDIWETHKYIQRGIHGKCGEWHDLAISVGWPESEWPTLSYVLYRESRCNIGSHNKTDPMSGSRGLMQINGFWCKPNKYSSHGWLQDNNILQTCQDLYHPTTNLQAGLAIWYYGEVKHGCGWRGPWATRCS